MTSKDATRLWELDRWVRAYTARAIARRPREAEFQERAERYLVARQFDRLRTLSDEDRLSAEEIEEHNAAPEQHREHRALLGPRLDRMLVLRGAWDRGLATRSSPSPDPIPSLPPVRFQLPDLDVINESLGYTEVEAITASRATRARGLDPAVLLAAKTWRVEDLAAYHEALGRLVRARGRDPAACVAAHRATLDAYARDHGLAPLSVTAPVDALVAARDAYSTLFRAVDRAAPMLAYRFFLASEAIREVARREGATRAEFRRRLAALKHVESRGSHPGRRYYSPTVVAELVAELAALPALARPGLRNLEHATDMVAEVREDVVAVVRDWEVFLPYWFLYVPEDRPDPRADDPRIDADDLTEQRLRHALQAETVTGADHVVRDEVYRPRPAPKALAWKIAAELFFPGGAETLRRATAAVPADTERLLHAMRRAWRGKSDSA